MTVIIITFANSQNYCCNKLTILIKNKEKKLCSSYHYLVVITNHIFMVTFQISQIAQ